MDHLYGIRIFGRSFFRFVTVHAFGRRSDGQTDGRTFCSWLQPPFIRAAR